MSPIDDDSARKVAKEVREHIRRQVKEAGSKTQANLHLDRDGYRKLQKKLGRGNVSAAIDLVIQYLLEELGED